MCPVHPLRTTRCVRSHPGGAVPKIFHVLLLQLLSPLSPTNLNRYQADLNECAAIRERLENELSIAKQELSQPPPACNCDDQVNLAVAEQQKLQAGLIDESELTPSMCGSKFRLWGTTTFALVAFTKVGWTRRGVHEGRRLCGTTTFALVAFTKVGWTWR